MTWSVWKLVVKAGKPIEKNPRWQAYMVAVGNEGSTKRRHFRLCIDSRTDLVSESKEVQEMREKHPGLLPLVEQTILVMNLQE